MYVVHSKTGYDYAMTFTNAKELCEMKNGFLIRWYPPVLFPEYDIEWERKCEDGDKKFYVFLKDLL